MSGVATTSLSAGAASSTVPPSAADWPARFGAWVERAPDSRTLSHHASSASWRLRPPNVGGVLEVLRTANIYGTPIYPVSRGCNWGYGSHLPARAGGIVLDLRELARISDLDLGSLSVRIEPGVTQRQLYEYLAREAPQLAFNVTGSGADTSILGNALDRGLGYAGEKEYDIYSIEAALADGTLIGPAPATHHPARRQAAGFSTDALFFQANYGVVLGARLRLRLRQPAEDAIVVQGTRPALLEFFRRAYADKLLLQPTHIAEPGRSRRLGFGLLRILWKRRPTEAEIARYFPGSEVYSGLVPVHGRRAVANAVWRELKSLNIAGLKLQRVNARKLQFANRWLARLGLRHVATRLAALEPLLALTWGVPSDVGLASLDGFEGGNPDHAAQGAIYGNAVASLQESSAREISAILAAHWQDSAITWTLIDDRCLIAVYTLHFQPADAAAAHSANREIIAALRAAAFPPYRLGAGTPGAVRTQHIYKTIKDALDPKHLIAPGRYE